MSSNQSLKNELFSNLSKQGFHDDIKKQLRMKLIQQLKEKKMVENKNQSRQLFRRVLSSLIMEDLQLNNFPFTESIYSIESGFQNAHMTRNELIELLTFKRGEIKESESILQFMLRKKQPFSATTMQSVDIQTNPQQIGYTLEQKLMMVDQQYRRNLLEKQNLNKNNIFDRKKFQLQLTERYKKQIDLFKQFQTHKIKIKTSQQWRIKFEQYSQQLAEQYRRKYDFLRKKDKQLNQEYILKHNQLNIKMNESQKIINQKIQMLDIKSTTIQTQMQNLQRAKKDYQEQMSKKDKQVTQKIRQYDNLCLNVKEKIKYEVNLVKLSIQQEYQQKQAQTLRRKKIIDQEYGKLMGIKDSIDIVEKQNARLSTENNNLRNRLTTLQTQLKTTVVELGNKVDRIETLKDDLVQQTEKNKILEEKVKDEAKKSKRYESQIVSMRQELQKLRLKQNVNNNNVSQISQSSFQVQKNPESKKLEEVNKRLQRLKNQRKKDIEKFKLQI